MRVSDVAACHGVHTSSIVPRLQTLERAGLIRRGGQPDQQPATEDDHLATFVNFRLSSSRVAVETPNADVALDDAAIDVPRHARRHHPPPLHRLTRLSAPSGAARMR